MCVVLWASKSHEGHDQLLATKGGRWVGAHKLRRCTPPATDFGLVAGFEMRRLAGVRKPSFPIDPRRLGITVAKMSWLGKGGLTSWARESLNVKLV